MRFTRRGTPPDASVDFIQGGGGEFDPAVATACHVQPMPDVTGHAITTERLQLAPHRDPLIDLPHLWQLQVRPKLALSDENHLKQLSVVFEIRKNAYLLEQRERQVLRFVDDEDRKCLEGRKGDEKLVEHVIQVRPRCSLQTAHLQIFDRHHAEVHEEHLEKVFT